MFRSIRNAFITGVVVILPLGVTFIVINFMRDRLGVPASNFFFGAIEAGWKDSQFIQLLLQFISIFIVFLLITAIGYGSRFFIGRILLNSFEKLLDRVPLINTVYRTVKQIVDTFSKQKKAVFQEVVLIEYPRKGSYAIGFLTSKAKGETQDVTGEPIVNIFVPTTPNPTSGFLLMLPEDDVTHLKMSVADGMKVIISGGAVAPPASTNDEAVKINNPVEAHTKP